MDNEGSIISIFADPTSMNNEGHTIQYNLFKDILGFIEHQSSSSSATTASSMEEKENPISEQSGEEATSKDAAV